MTKRRTDLGGRLYRGDPVKRFWSWVDKPDEKSACWRWAGATGRSKWGYGHLSVDGVSRLAHRFSWEIHFGSIPSQLVVRHTCDNPLCCNPNHLLLGSHRDNMNDRQNRQRQARGERHGHAKLTKRDVKDIRSRAHMGEAHSKIAVDYEISVGTVSNIKTSHTWSHI